MEVKRAWSLLIPSGSNCGVGCFEMEQDCEDGDVRVTVQSTSSRTQKQRAG
jgi:hypothetical protein